MKAQANQFIACDKSYKIADTVVFGAPYDSTTSFRPGTRFGPGAMRAESCGIETYSPIADMDLVDDTKVFDAGDLELSFGSPVPVLRKIERMARKILADGKRPFLLGGEHLVTLPVVKAALERYPDLVLLHFDAHADLREDYLGNALSHACVIRRCHDLLGDGRIFQFGIRSGTREEFRFMKEGHVTAEPFDDDTLDDVLKKIGPMRPVYLTIDMDVLDPSEFPGTGTQEAGGFTYMKLLSAMRKICAAANVVAMDNVELNPGLDTSGRSTALACKFLRECLLSLAHQ